MNLKQLEAFVIVAEEGSFSKAAKTLFLTQPTVSAHIASLEQELGVRLFVRSTKEVGMSKDGHKLFGYAKQMTVLQREIEAIFDRTRREKSHCIHIAASSVPSQHLLPQILAEFRRKYPNEQFKIMETDSAKVVEQVVNGNAEIGFTGTVLEKKHCKYTPFYEDELVVITPNTEKFRKLQAEEMQVQESSTQRQEQETQEQEPQGQKQEKSWMEEEPLILREEGSGTRKEAEKLLKKMGIQRDGLKIAATMENQETIKRSVSKGVGISLISRLSAEEEIKEGKVLSFPFSGEDGRRSLNIIYNKNNQLSSLAANFFRVASKVYPYGKG